MGYKNLKSNIAFNCVIQLLFRDKTDILGYLGFLHFKLGKIKSHFESFKILLFAGFIKIYMFFLKCPLQLGKKNFFIIIKIKNLFFILYYAQI
ncbi:hypothetical protein EAJ29_04305 [Campylobacter upsaliensis]|nr:hypothetical protein [Campylobacter upsaliensis]